MSKQKESKFTETSERAIAESKEKFEQLDLSETTRAALKELGWEKPTPVQSLCLPLTLDGQDVAGFAQTGTGKTGVFILTCVEKLIETINPEARIPACVILAPTRELAMQIEQDAQAFFKAANIESIAVFGGTDYEKQANKIKGGVDVIVATPGRLKDFCQKKLVDMGDIELFVCDEADRMFDMGFIEDLQFFLERLPEDAQKLMFSATTNELVKELAFEYLENPEYVSVNPETLTPEKIEQLAIHVNAQNKLKVMMGLLKDHKPHCAIVFTNTKLTAEWLQFKLVNNGIEADLITGDLPQKKRIRLIQRIKNGELKVLIATDVASRGLHIAGVTHVYNFDVPDDPANYVHRIGRTARAGAEGKAITLVCDDYGQNMTAINELLSDRMDIRTEWYDEAYLNIEDKAGNPFAQKPRNESNERPRRNDDRSSRDHKSGNRQGKRAGASRGNGKDSRNRNSRRDRDGNKSHEGRRGKSHNRDQHRDNKKSHKPGAPKAAAAAAAPQKKDNVLKKFVKAIFGRR